jgi:acetyl esterase/lipase
MRTLALLFMLLLPVAEAQNISQSSPAPRPAVPPNVRVLRDLAYVPDGTARQKLDLYLPQAPGPARPLVAYIHGGGWKAGSKDHCPAIALVGRGYAVASIEYRFSQDAIYPAQIEDCKAAIRWLRAHSAEYGIDPQHIGVWGASAGGHLVALLGVTGQIKDFDTGANLDQSSAVQCVVDFFGPTDFLHYGEHPDPARDTASSSVAQLLGGTIETHEDLARKASAVYYITKDAAPFLIVHGDHDPLVPLQQSQELQADLQKAGVSCTLMVVPGGGHGGAGFMTPERQKAGLDFFNRYLKPKGEAAAVGHPEARS